MAKYIAVRQSDGTFEVESLPGIIWDKVSAIRVTPLVGAEYWNPNTGKSSTLTGSFKYESLTSEVLLSKVQFENELIPFLSTDKAINGDLSATHILGGISSTLSGVRYAGIEYGSFDKLSNDAAKVQCTWTFEGIKHTTSRNPSILGLPLPTF